MKRLNRTHHAGHATYSEPGFSLIEVLIAILVLALGLIGLAAVFPAVIVEQRRSFDTIAGETVAEIAQSALSVSGLVDTSVLRGSTLGLTGGVPPEPLPGEFVGQGRNVPPTYDSLWIMDDFVRIDGRRAGEWDRSAPIPGAAGVGDLRLGNWRVDSGDIRVEELLPVTARLHPAPESGIDPQYVWDPVVRRTASGAAQVGIFVRRIDDRIAVAAGETLSEVLTASGNDRRLPLAVEPTTGRLTTDRGGGNLFYPPPQSVRVYAHEDQPTWLIFEEPNLSGGGTDTSFGFIRRVGQKLLDNTGVVRTVVALPQPRAGDRLANLAQRAVVVSPPFTSSNTSNGQESIAGGVIPSAWVRQIAFTPQIPVAVRVFTLEKE